MDEHFLGLQYIAGLVFTFRYKEHPKTVGVYGIPKILIKYTPLVEDYQHLSIYINIY